MTTFPPTQVRARLGVSPREVGQPYQIILITGASSGLGAALARVMARPGRFLALTARRVDRLHRVAQEARERGAETLEIPADLSISSGPRIILEKTLDAFGGLDVLVNNAGLGLPQLFHGTESQALRSQIEVNFTAPLMLTHRALPHLIARKGMVINISSAITSVPIPFLGAYGATKAGLSYWNDALRREVAHLGVRVCLVEPGPIQTEFHEALVERAGGERQLAETMDPPPFLTARVDDVAQRVASLLDRPRRRIAPLRRMTVPWDWLGALFRLVPPLGDAVAQAAIRRYAHNQEIASPTRGDTPLDNVSYQRLQAGLPTRPVRTSFHDGSAQSNPRD